MEICTEIAKKKEKKLERNKKHTITKTVNRKNYDNVFREQ